MDFEIFWGFFHFMKALMAESDEELKRLLMKAKEESEKVGFKLKIQKTKIMADRKSVV